MLGNLGARRAVGSKAGDLKQPLPASDGGDAGCAADPEAAELVRFGDSLPDD